MELKSLSPKVPLPIDAPDMVMPRSEMAERGRLKPPWGLVISNNEASKVINPLAVIGGLPHLISRVINVAYAVLIVPIETIIAKQINLT